jgi:peroxiredoxin
MYQLEETTAMRKSLLAFGVTVLLAASVVAGPGKYNKVIAPGDKAPPFSGIQGIMGEKDTVVNLDDLKDDVVVLVFLANHCPYVTKVEDRVIDFTNDYKDKNVKVVGVCVTPSSEYAPEGYNKEYCAQDTIEKIRQRIGEKKYNFVYGRDDSQKIGRDYGAVATPTFFVLDKERKIRYAGALDDNIDDESKVTKKYLREAVDAVLTGKPVETDETRVTGCAIGYRKTE